MYYMFLLIMTSGSSEIQQNEILNTLYLTENENISFSGSGFIIASNNSEFKISQDIQAHQILEEQFRYELTFDNLFTVLSYDEQHIKICFSLREQIFCKINILNELIDGKLQVNSDDLVININCQQMLNFQKNQYLLFCHKRVYIYNGTISEVINVQSDFPLKFDYREGQLIIYEAETDNSSLLLYQNNDFTNPQQFWINYHENVGKIIDMKIFHILEIVVTFEYLELMASLMFPHVKQPTHLIKPNFQVLFRNHKLICGINFNQTEQFSFKNNVLGFSNNSELPKAALLTQNMIIMSFQKSTVINYIGFFNYTIQSSFSQIISLEKLPFIIAVQNDQLVIYRIALNKIQIRNQVSQYIYYFLNGEIPHQQYELKTYNLEKPEIILKQPQNYSFISNQNPNYFQLNSAGIPFIIKQILPENIQIFYQFQTSFDLGEGNILLIEDNGSIIALTESNSEIFIQIENTTTVKSKGNLTNLFFYDSYKIFVQIQGSWITQFKLISQQLQRINFIDVQVQIDKYKFGWNKFTLLLSNCSIINYKISNGVILNINEKVYENLFFNECTQNYNLLNTFIQLNSNKITLTPFESYRRTYSFTEIFDCDQVKNNRLIIYELIDQKIQIKIYLFENLDLVFLYNLPLYNHTIKYPIRRSIQERYFVIEAIFEEQSYLLIYDFQYSASSVLKKIIKIDDRKRMSFNFLGKSCIYYVYNNQIQYQLIDKVQFVPNTNASKYYQKIQVSLKLESLICCSIANYSTFFVIVNDAQNLRLGSFRNQQIAHGNKKRYIQISGIIGSINDIQLITNTCTISKPFTQIFDIECSQYLNRSCLTQNNEIIIDIFGKQKSLLNQSAILNLISLQSISDEEWYVIYQDENSTILKKHLFLKESNTIKRDTILSNYFLEKMRVKKQVQNLFIFYKPFSSSSSWVIKIKDDQLELVFDHLLAVDIFSIFNIQIILGCDYNNAKFITLIENDQVTTQILINDNQEESIALSQFFIEDIFILSAKFKDQILTLRYLSVFQTYSAYLFEVQINLITKQYQLLRLKTIRYGFIGKIRKVFCSSDLMVIQVFDLSLKCNVFFYDLKNEQEMIDYYYTLFMYGLEKFEKYNQTHYVVVEELESELYKTTLVKIEDYSIICDSNLNINTFNLRLQNSVSELEIVINYQMQSEGKIIYLILLSINLAIIILLLKCNKKSAKLNKL